MAPHGESDPQHGEAHDSSYILIWGILVAALIVSLVIGTMSIPVVTMVLIFSIAVVKAYLVLAYFIHLRREPVFVVLIVVAGIACLYFLFFGLVPDIVMTPKG